MQSPLNHLEWVGDGRAGHLRLLDQTRLPLEEVFLDCRDVQAVWEAIKRLSVRGAPAIGIAAAYGCVLGVQGAGNTRASLDAAAEHLATSRPTAVNLFWALRRMQAVEPPDPEALLAEAKAIHEEDQLMCRRIGEHALPLLREHAIDRDLAVLTHCNAGALATGGIGTATAPMYLAHKQHLPIRVYADETRPLLQGARHTAWELGRAGIDVTLICDDMAAHIMRAGRIGAVITGADRIAANGDVANKIGTYNLAVLAHHHGLPFYVAAPASTFDMEVADGDAIPIEQRAAEEITEGFGRRIAPPGVKTESPAFDITPARLVTALISDRGVIQPVGREAIESRMLAGQT